MSEISRSDLIGIVARSKSTMRLEKSAMAVGEGVPLVLDLYIVLQGDKKLLDHCEKISGEIPKLMESWNERLITLCHEVPGTGIIPDHIYLSVWG